jgi:hypothetical protein
MGAAFGQPEQARQQPGLLERAIREQQIPLPTRPKGLRLVVQSIELLGIGVVIDLQVVRQLGV